MKKIAVVGAEGSIGREVLSFLADGGYNVADVVALEPRAPLGTQASFGEDDDIDVLNLDDFDFSGVDIAVFATSEEISKRFVSKALDKGAKVIDCSSCFFSDADVPMIVAGVNDDKLSEAKRGLVSVPSAAVTQILLPLVEVDKKYSISRLVVSTYTSVSVYGKEGMDELFSQTRKIFMNESLADNQKVFDKQIAFNAIPQVEDFIGDETKYEWSINAETKKVLGRDIKVHANCAFIPAFVGSAAYVNVECANDVDVDDVAALMKTTKDVIVFDKKVKGGYVTLNDVQGEIEVYVSRLRQDVSVENGFSFWCAADNLRFGVAGNVYKIIRLWEK
uniref:Aspartate-semialdehyde dehydrogenase n=1 Tax=uncultured Alphaproteobacteria bacterium TaxID=91750 RepID=A0A6G8F256_9PROT|nr:aspartate-semialdehyde dehydrogenase [uncultured Alphaproteobacteria bacterium]